MKRIKKVGIGGLLFDVSDILDLTQEQFAERILEKVECSTDSITRLYLRLRKNEEKFVEQLKNKEE